jgi:flagellar basal-body rod protein FlgB
MKTQALSDPGAGWHVGCSVAGGKPDPVIRMAINFDNALGLTPKALQLLGQRTAVLANNIANANTPNYKARELPFQAMLSEAMNGDARESMATTNARHIDANPTSSIEGDLRYRVPLMPAIDGNTVDVHVEQAAFAENALQFQASLRFLDGRFRGLISAIRGE